MPQWQTPHALLQRTKVADSLWEIGIPGFARRGYRLRVCLPQWEIRQKHNCFYLSRLKGLLGRLTTCFSQSPNVLVSRLMELGVNLPAWTSLSHSLPEMNEASTPLLTVTWCRTLHIQDLLGLLPLIQLTLLKWLHKKSLQNKLSTSSSVLNSCTETFPPLSVKVVCCYAVYTGHWNVASCVLYRFLFFSNNTSFS